MVNLATEVYSHRWSKQPQRVHRDLNGVILILLVISILGTANKCFAEMDAKIGATQHNICEIINSGDMQAAKSAMDKMLSDYANHKDLPEAIYWTICHCEWRYKYDEAKRLYHILGDKFPSSTFITKSQITIERINLLEAQQNICKILNSDDMQAAKAAMDKMLSDFADHKDLPEAIYSTIRHCEWTCKYDEAKRLYQILADKFPSSSFAGKSKLGITKLETVQIITSQDYNSVKPSINKMTQDFAGNPELAESLFMIAERLEWQFQFEDEKWIFQYIIQNYSKSPFVSKAQIGIARANLLAYIVAKDNVRFESGLDKLFTDFANNPELAQTAIITGELFYKNETLGSDHLEKAVKIWDRVIKELPNSDLIPEACCWAGDCYQKMGKYDDSSQKFQKVIDAYPAYKFAGHAQYEIGHNYQKLAESKMMILSDAQTKTKLVYEQLLRKYPNCKEAADARMWLYKHN